MRVPEWMRNVWHPSYGNYGGKNARCRSNKTDGSRCPLPVDKMDSLFQRHDHDLREARRIYSPGTKRERQVQKADEDLALGLRSLSPFFGYHYPLYGPIYRFLAVIPFRK